MFPIPPITLSYSPPSEPLSNKSPPIYFSSLSDPLDLIQVICKSMGVAHIWSTHTSLKSSKVTASSVRLETYIFILYMPVSVHVCACACVCGMHLPVSRSCGGQRSMLVSFSSCSTLFLETGSPTESGGNCLLDRAISKPLESVCLHPHHSPPVLGSRHAAASGFHRGIRNLNSGPHVCIVGILFTEPSPHQP